MTRMWRRDEVELGMVVTKDIIENEGPLLYRVVGIVDEPVVVLAPLDERDGEDQEHYVIGSPLFAEFHLVRAASEPGRYTLNFGEGA